MNLEKTEDREQNVLPERGQSRSALYQFITSAHTSRTESSQRFQSSFNPYRKQEKTIFSLGKPMSSSPTTKAEFVG